MKLECKIKRSGGTDVDLLDGSKVQFRPIDATRADSPHIAEVTASQAQALFRADANVYVVFDENAPRVQLAPPSPPPPAPKQEPAALMGSSTLPAHIDLGAGKMVPLGEVVRAAFEASGLTTDQWNNLDHAQRDAKLTALIEAARIPPPPPAASSEAPSTAGESAADTNGDGALSVRELKAGIADGTLTQERIRELMAAEEASAEPRSSFIAECVKALK